VAIDTSDWYIDNRLKARLQADPQSSVDPYRRFYLDHIWDRATFYDDLAKSLFGHSIDHSILLHHRLMTGLFLDDMLSMFGERGWRLVDAEVAFASSVFALAPKALPAVVRSCCHLEMCMVAQNKCTSMYTYYRLILHRRRISNRRGTDY
jgi:hypothetical protein